jgi:hypothetical protein
MNLKIIKSGFPLSCGIGIDNTGKKYKVIGGELFVGHQIKCEKFSSDNDGLYVIPELNYKDMSKFSKYYDKDNLIRFNQLKEVPIFSNKICCKIYEIGKYWVFLDDNIRQIVDYLESVKMSNFLKVKLTRDRLSHQGRAPIISIKYNDILKKAIKSKEPIKARFYCEDKYRDESKGVYADLIIRCYHKEKDKIQLEMWQIIDKNNFVYYVHGYINPDTFKFTHFDIAYHGTTKQDIINFVKNNMKMRIIKNKLLVLDKDDGIESIIIFNIMKMFFPMDKLIDEFLCEKL